MARHLHVPPWVAAGSEPWYDADMTLETELALGLTSGLLVLISRRLAPLAWVALAPLAVVLQEAEPQGAALAGAATGLALAIGPLYRRFPGGMVLFTSGVTALTWAALGACVALLRPRDTFPGAMVYVPAAALLSMLPLRALGAPRWLSNPLASTQEGTSFVLHAAGRASDPAVTVALALTAASVSLMWTERMRGEQAWYACACGLILVALWLMRGRRRELVLRRRCDAAPKLRVAAVAADPRGLADDAELARNVAAALKRYHECLGQAVRAGARIVALPEVAVTLTPATRDEWFRGLSGWARSGRLVLLAGHYDEVTRQNLTVVIDPQGMLVAEYEKQHPGPHEPRRHQRMPPLHHRIPGLPPISTVTCADLDYTDYLGPVARAGGVLLAPANDWPRLERLHHRSAIWAVTGSRVPLVRATGHGISAIWDASGRLLAEANSLDGPVTLVADLPISAS